MDNLKWNAQRILDEMPPSHLVVKEAVLMDALRRAEESGADIDALTYVGAGAEGLVLAEDAIAYKIAWNKTHSLARTAEVLFILQESEARGYVVPIIDYFPEQEVIAMEYIERAPAPWGMRARGRNDTYEVVKRALRRRDLSAPEYKEDSFIFSGQLGHFVMVDLGFVHAMGRRLLRETAERVEGIEHEVDVRDLSVDIAFLKRERYIDARTLQEWREIIRQARPWEYADLEDMLT